MRNIVTITSIFVLFISQLGFYLIYTIRQCQLKEEMEQQLLARLPDSALEIVIADENNKIIWEEEGKEFTLNGQWYDVAKTRQVNGKTWIYCVNDKKEEALLRDLANASAANSNEGRDKDHKPGPKFQWNDIFTEIELISFPGLEVTAWSGFDHKASICSSFIKVDSPPPRSL